MSAMFTTFVTSVWNHILNNEDIANIGDAAGLQNSAANGSLYVTWATSWPGDSGNQSTGEATYTGYTRTAVARNPGSPAWTVSGKTATPAAAIQGGTRTDAGATQDIVAVTIGGESSGAGTPILRAIVGGAAKAFTATTGDTITSASHGFIDDSRVMFFAYETASLPTGLTEGTRYFVINAATDTFQVSATQGGGAVDLTAAGYGTVAQSQQLSINQGNAPQITTSTTFLLQ